MQRLLNLPGPFVAIERANGSLQVVLGDEPDDEIGGSSVGRDRYIEMVHAGRDIGNDRGDLRPAIGQVLAFDEYPDRLIEFADAVCRSADLQFSVERDLEEAVLDLVVGKIRPFGSAPAADVGVFRLRSAADPGKRNRDRRGRQRPGQMPSDPHVCQRTNHRLSPRLGRPILAAPLWRFGRVFRRSVLQDSYRRWCRGGPRPAIVKVASSAYLFGMYGRCLL
jgi:hypothetical protein